MRIPGFTRKKSSKGPTDDAAQTTYLQPNGSGSNASLNRTRSGASDLTEFGANAASRISIDQPAKRSFFKRAHSRSLSSDAQRKLDLAGQDEQMRRAVPATISVAGGHPLRQQTLPQDLEPAKGKRPLLFSKRAATSIASSLQPQQLSPASSRGVSPLVDPTGNAAQSQDSFQLKGFRSVSGVKEERPTLSSLVDADVVSSPVSTRPNSPSLGQSGSYFDNMPTQRAGDSVPSGSHDRTYSSGSISVAKFREARAARSSSSLASSDRGTATGLKLDLPPPITMDYNRPFLSSIQPAGRQSVGSSYVASPVSASAVSLAFPAMAASSAQQGDSNSITESQEVLAPPVDGPRSAPLLASLAAHPDNTLPLPPLPADPRRSFQGHSRRTSTQSITSISSAFGGWLNSTTSNFGIAFSVEDVQKAINSGASVLRAASPAQDQHPIFPRVADGPKAKEDEQEVISPVATGPTKEELEILLGGKVLPPPPSETGNDEFGLAVRAKSASPTPILSRTSSLTNLSSGLSTAKHLFSSGVARMARASKVADDSSSESSIDLQASRPFKVPNTSAAKKTKLFGDSSSDEESEKDEEDSDDSDVERKRAERARVFPPPRPITQQEREHVYRSAQASPFVSPHGSTVDLRSSTVPLVQPVPRIPALTTSALTALNDEEEENIPLSAIRGRRSGAMSELGLAMPRTTLGTPLYGNPGLSNSQQQQAPSAIGVALSGSGPEKSAPLLASLSTSKFPPASERMSRSLSSFNTTSSDIALNPRTYMRSASSQGAQPRPSNVTLSSLIDAELSRSQRSSDASAGPKDPGLGSRPSSSSDNSSIPKTPSEVSVAVKAGQSDFLPKQHRSTRSDLGLMSSRPSGPRAPASSLSVSRHGKSSSVPLASLPESGSVHNRMKERHRAEARKSSLDSGQGASSAPSDATAFSQYATQSYYQEMPAPPGVDPQLYASLPNDQKQALQLRSAQLLALMQGYAMQAQANMLAHPQQPVFQGQTPPFMPSSFPYPIQMPMMGSPLSSFPSFPSFAGPFGYPLASSLQQPSHVQHPYVPRSAVSALGMPSQGSPQKPYPQQRLPVRDGYQYKI